MATHSSILAWKIPWTEEPDRLQSMGSQESDTTEHMSINFFEILFCELSFGFMMKFSIVIAFASDSHS